MNLNLITKEGLENIANHKYNGGEYTWLDNKMNIFWYKLIDFMPTSIAPNLITLIGFIPILMTCLLFFFFGNDTSISKPCWLYLLSIIAIFFYQTMDALDGKQARKIGLSTPMGALFDHGIDCMVLTYISYMTLHFVHINPDSFYIIILGIINYLCFYGSTYCEYYNGVLET